jgi:hypothetical protein
MDGMGTRVQTVVVGADVAGVTLTEGTHGSMIVTVGTHGCSSDVWTTGGQDIVLAGAIKRARPHGEIEVSIVISGGKRCLKRGDKVRRVASGGDTGGAKIAVSCGVRIGAMDISEGMVAERGGADVTTTGTGGRVGGALARTE